MGSHKACSRVSGHIYNLKTVLEKYATIVQPEAKSHGRAIGWSVEASLGLEMGRC